MTRTGGRPVVLVLRALGVGDFATGVPALRALRRAHPDAWIGLAVSPTLAPLVASCGAVDEVVPADGVAALPATLDVPYPAGAVTLAVNLHGKGPQSHRLLQAVEPAALAAFASDTAGCTAGPEWRGDEHEITRWCRLLSWYGWESDPGDLRLPAPPEPPDGWAGAVVVHPGAGSPRRRWPPARYAAVARALARAGHRVVVTGSPGEEPLARTVAAAALLPRAAVLAGRTSVVGFAATIAHARLLICGDTGAGHLATAYGTPSILLFGPMPPRLWGPPPDARHRVLWHGDGHTAPHSPPVGDGPDPTVLRISVAEVLDAVFALVGSH